MFRVALKAFNWKGEIAVSFGWVKVAFGRGRCVTCSLIFGMPADGWLRLFLDYPYCHHECIAETNHTVGQVSFLGLHVRLSPTVIHVNCRTLARDGYVLIRSVRKDAISPCTCT